MATQGGLFDGAEVGATAGAWAGDARASPMVRPLSQAFDAVPPTWRAITDAFRASPTGRTLLEFVESRRQAGARIYPPEVLRALHLTALPEVRVVILGQDPYHGAGQAEGLAFSVPTGQRLPPSLRNIQTELQRDLGQDLPDGGSLLPWARQGVLLLNTTLTVEEGRPASHARRGWERLTDDLIAAVAARGLPAVYMLWGAHAQAKATLVAAHTPPGAPVQVLTANHPSPLSARRPPQPFLGCGHFGLAQRWLATHGHALNWGART